MYHSQALHCRATVVPYSDAIDNNERTGVLFYGTEMDRHHPGSRLEEAVYLKDVDPREC